tara:strand:- start:274 stop:420 length:147 start_codon:yes stop_codon:yes gene_type:complete
MRSSSQLALRKQITREINHLKWLQQHLPKSKQQQRSKQRITHLLTVEH